MVVSAPSGISNVTVSPFVKLGIVVSGSSASRVITLSSIDTIVIVLSLSKKSPTERYFDSPSCKTSTVGSTVSAPTRTSRFFAYMDFNTCQVPLLNLSYSTWNRPLVSYKKV